jgi:hypothetical protein
VKLKIKYTFCSLGLLLFSCGSEPEGDGGYITSAGGEEEIDSALLLEELPEYDLIGEALSVRLFCELTNEQLGTDYCYDGDAVKNLLMGEVPDEFTWTDKEISERYLRFENQACYVTTEFVIKGDGERMWSMLLQSSENGQQIDVFHWNEGGQKWVNMPFPKPNRTEFYNDLAESDYNLVKEFGYFYAAMENQGETLKYVFSTLQMSLNADGKEIMSFNREPDFSFQLIKEQEYGFWLKKHFENNDLIPERFFLAYSESGEIRNDFTSFSSQIEESLRGHSVQYSFADFSETDYKGFFKTDTFDFSSMRQFEERNGFWFFERGKEPLDLEYDMVDETAEKAMRYFDEK